MKKALITGISGQDGSYLAELLLAKGYEVHGIVRRSSSLNTARIDGIYQDPHVPEARLRLVYGDLNDASSLNRILRTIQPDEIYNLGAQSHVRVSFDVPEYTAEVTALGTVRLLEAIRESEQIAGRELDWTLSSENRIGDHRWWISDLSAFERDYPSWKRRFGITEILQQIHQSATETAT